MNDQDTPSIEPAPEADYNGNTATYSPEDNKLRLYVGRVPRDEYLKLRADGWTSTPKQNCNFVATWTPSRRDTALEYAGIIGDEDMGPDERAADRAERFGDYRDKRLGEATGRADTYDAGPSAHGYQSAARAERAAARYDRLAGRACDSWGKAEYWTRRTAGVISHSLHLSSPGVRMGRIKTIEAELRKNRASITQAQKFYDTWVKVAAEPDAEKQTKLAIYFANNEPWGGRSYPNPATGKTESLWRLLEPYDNEYPAITGAQAAALWLANNTRPESETDWTRHYTLRLAYENQMLEAQGGRAAFVEMEAGGWIGSYQIRKVNRSSATGRVVSVNVLHPKGWSGYTKASEYKEYVTRPAIVTLNIERLKPEEYRPPTAEDKAALESIVTEEKAKAPTKAPCPLINPTDADAERLQAIWNARALKEHCAHHLEKYRQDYAGEFKPAKVTRCTQAVYSNASKGYGTTETRGLCRDGELKDRESNLYSSEGHKRAARIGKPLCNVRVTSGGGNWFTPDSVIVLTDKPQKPLPAQVWEPMPAQPELVTV